MDHGAPTKSSKLLPANAYTKLAPGEEYQPVVPTTDTRAEVTKWSISMGLIMVVIFSAACIYMALRAGNAIEASIPIAILAVFFGKKGPFPLRSTKSTLLENVIVQSIGQAAGVVAAGAAFLIPALYINRLEVAWWQIFLACFIGGVLGVVLIIPLRKYFVKDQHGELPFPEATAINEILVSGESSGGSAGKTLLYGFGLGALYDFLGEGLSFWNPMMTTKTLLGGLGQRLADLRMELSVNGLAALFGLGYIIGLRYAAVIAAGSILSSLVLVPLVYHFGSQAEAFQYAGAVRHISEMGAGDIFRVYVKPIGIGTIAMAGVIGIIRMGKIVAGSVSLGFKGLKGGQVDTSVPRTQSDMSPRNVLLIQAGSAVLMGLFFLVVAMTTRDAATGEAYSFATSLTYAVVGTIAGFVLSFLFTPVAAQAIATVGTNPVSGMTLITVVLTIGTLVVFGLKGSGGMFVALIVGCAVCTALSTSGALITDFKIGYWLGSTPRHQQVWKFVGIALAALVVAFVIPLMDSAYRFVIQDAATGAWISNEKVLPAPQANMLAAVARGFIEDPASQPWLLYGLGAVVAIVLYMAQLPILAFALGMYLPLSINLAVLAGAFVAWVIGNTGANERVKQARKDQGTLIASGLMAGAAIFGILTAILRQTALGAPIQFLSIGSAYTIQSGPTGAFLDSTSAEWYEGVLGQGVSAAAFVLLAVACFWFARKGADGTIAEEDAAEKK